jgi:hypothetical protein
MIAKRMILALVVAALVAIPVTTAGAGPNDDGTGVKTSKVSVNAKMKVLTGSWIFTLTAPGMPPFKSLFTFIEDGGLVTTGAFLVPFPPPVGRAVFSAGHGEWDKIRNGEFSFTFVVLIHTEDAVLIATSKVDGTLQVNDAMDTLSGAAHACDLDPGGNVIFCFDGSIQAERIRVGS